MLEPINDTETNHIAVAYLPLSALKPAARNARTHSPAQVQQIARSIAEFGWTNPILIDEHNAIIAGHGRFEAARSRAMDQVPTITLAGLSADQKRALAIADNQLALNAGWDAETLRLELGELGAAGFDVSLVGFSDEALAEMLNEPDFGPGSADDQGRLDEKARVICPECGHEFAP